MPTTPNIAFERPLFMSDRMRANWSTMRHMIISPERLEAAYHLVQADPQVKQLKLTDADAKALADLYNKVVTNGDSRQDFIKDPAKIAAKYHVTLSAVALDQLRKAGAIKAVHDTLHPGGGTNESPVEVVAVAIIVLVLARPTDQLDHQIVVNSAGAIRI